MQDLKNISVDPLFDIVFLNPSFKPFDVNFIKTKFEGLQSGNSNVFFLVPMGCDEKNHEFFCLHTDPATNFYTYQIAKDKTKYKSITISGFSTDEKLLEAILHYIRHHTGVENAEVLINDLKNCGIMEKWQAMQKRLSEDKKDIH
ncbi:MAG: hypothetical protein LBF22_11905 [Deltaproteobacteria bacterium]|nr:hypothetical protein [Deltaproteobacteria bacterium]